MKNKLTADFTNENGIGFQATITHDGTFRLLFCTKDKSYEIEEKEFNAICDLKEFSRSLPYFSNNGYCNYETDEFGNF